MKKTITRYLIASFFFVCFASCTQKIKYEDIYDPIQEVGQFQLPSLEVTPKYCWFLKIDNPDPQSALKDYFLATSISGLTAKAIQENKTNVGIWIKNNNDNHTWIYGWEEGPHEATPH